MYDPSLHYSDRERNWRSHSISESSESSIFGQDSSTRIYWYFSDLQLTLVILWHLYRHGIQAELPQNMYMVIPRRHYLILQVSWIFTCLMDWIEFNYNRFLAHVEDSITYTRKELFTAIFGGWEFFRSEFLCWLKWHDQANILISNNGRAIVSDFGLSRTLTHSKFSSTLNPGNYAWVAPELFDADKKVEHTIESDIWACGMTILVSCLRVEMHQIIIEC